MSNRLRVTFYNKYPLMNVNCSHVPQLHVTAGCPRPGIAVEMITLLTNYLNLTIDVSVKDYWDFGEMFDMLEGNKTDLFAALLTNTTLRAKRFDFTEVLYETYIKIAVKRTDRSLRDVFSFFNVYKWDAWLGMTSTFLLFTVFALLVRYAECRLRLRREGRFSEILWKMLRFQLVQSDRMDYKLIAGYSSLLFFSVFQVCIILGLFQGFILTSVVRKKEATSFSTNDNLAQLIADKKLFLVTATVDDWFYQEIKANYASPFFELREALKSNNLVLTKTNEEVLEIIEKGNGGVALMQADYPILFLAEHYCNLAYVKSPIPAAPLRLMFRKGSPLVPLFNKAIKANTYKIEVIRRKYLDHRPPSKCTVDSGRPAALTISPYYGLLMMFSSGVLLASIVFGAELLKFGVFGLGTPNSPKTDDTDTPKTQTPITKCPNCMGITEGGGSTILSNLNDRLVAYFLNASGLPSNTKLVALIPRKEATWID